MRLCRDNDMCQYFTWTSTTQTCELITDLFTTEPCKASAGQGVCTSGPKSCSADCYLEHFNFPSGTLIAQYEDVETAQACQSRCALHTSCAVFVYNKSDRTCQVKSTDALSKRVQDPTSDYVSGPRQFCDFGGSLMAPQGRSINQTHSQSDCIRVYVHPVRAGQMAAVRKNFPRLRGAAIRSEQYICIRAYTYTRVNIHPAYTYDHAWWAHPSRTVGSHPLSILCLYPRRVYTHVRTSTYTKSIRMVRRRRRQEARGVEGGLVMKLFSTRRKEEHRRADERELARPFRWIHRRKYWIQIHRST